MDSGHESHFNFKLVMDSLDHRSKSIGCARGTGDEVLRSIIVSLVHTHDNSLGVILGRSRVDDLFGSSINNGLGLLLGEEDTSGFTDVVSSKGTPADFLRVTASASLDLLSVQDQEVSINVNSLLGLSMDGIILVLVGHVVRGGRTSIDAFQVTRLIFHHDTGHKTSNATKSIDTHSGAHGHGSIVGCSLEGSSREGRSRESSGGADGGEDSNSRELHFSC
mmetsp:Transcript_26978/g.47623  ORF Transcript_26978/g.47623 Transcript_26978/m.47623 type:complete len:221 (-) Transcript_26978:37-699(-)